MNASIKKKWVAALRSGEYKQGRFKLRHSGRFCCLGVLCNLHAQAHPDIAAQQQSKESYLSSEALLPWDVFKWAGLADEVGGLFKADDGRYYTLPMLNDGDDGAKRHNFLEIADIIEAKL